MSGRRINGEGSIYPYPHGYRAHVWVTTPSGRRQRKYVAGKTREEVREKYLKLHEASRRGPVTTKVPTLAQFATAWVEEVIAPSLAPGTVVSYRMCLRLYVLPSLGGKRLDKLTVRDVQGWLNRLRSACQCCSQGKDAERDEPQCCAVGRCCHQVLADWTVHQAYAVLRAALSRAAR